jgi:hypothetical protein
VLHFEPDEADPIREAMREQSTNRRKSMKASAFDGRRTAGPCSLTGTRGAEFGRSADAAVWVRNSRIRK